MEARAETRERIAGALVLTVLALASVAWWIGVPLLTLWGLGNATEDGTTHFAGGLIGVPFAMALTAPMLIWLNGLYLRVTGALARAAADEQESGWRRQLGGPLEPIMFASLMVALVGLSIWFFFIAESAPTSIL